MNEPIQPVTHKALVRSMAAWLRNAQGCTIVLAELSTYNAETPDCIGFYSSGGGSVLVECKVSRSDFLADKAKSFRRYSEQGMGNLRYFAAPIGVIKPEDLPAGWGLIEVRDSLRSRRITVDPQRMEANKRAEVTMLVSAIRRLEISTAVFVQSEEETPPSAQRDET